MASQLELTTSFTNLLPEDNPMVDEFNMIIDEYDGSSSMLIVVEGESEKLKEFAEMAVPKIEALPEWVSRVDYKAPKDFMAKHGLMLMKSSAPPGAAARKSTVTDHVMRSDPPCECFST